MSKDRVFDAELVIDPRDALLQQGYLWTCSNVFEIPNLGARLWSWEVGSGQLASIDFFVLSSRTLVGDLVTILDYSGGTEIDNVNRNFSFAPTATAPSTTFRLDVTSTTVVGSGGNDILFIAGKERIFPPIIQPGPLHVGILLKNQDPGLSALANIVTIWHEQPAHKFPAGDPGP